MENTLLKNRDFNQLSQEEYLITNNIGSISAGTVAGANTSRHHGLLVATLPVSIKKRILVSKIEESIFSGRDTCIGLSTNQFPGSINPKGYQYIESFKSEPLPKWGYRIGNEYLVKTISIEQNTNTVIVKYENIGAECFQLSLNPLFVHRAEDQLFQQKKQFDFYYKQHGNRLKINAKYGASPLFFSFSKGTFKENRNWYKNFQYIQDKNKGLDYQEDAYSIGNVITTLCEGETIYLIFSTEEKMIYPNF